MLRTLAFPALLAGLLALGCAEVGKLASSAIEKPRLTFKAVRVDDVDLAGATLAFDLEIENPNAFGLEVARATYGIEAEGKRVASGEVQGGLTLPARGTAPLTVTARVRYEDVPGMAEFIGKRDGIHYQLSGTVGVRTALGIIDLPLSHDGVLALPRLPDLSLEGLAVHLPSLDRIALEVRVRIANENGFPLPAGRLRATLTLDGAEVAQLEDIPLTAVPAGKTAVVSIPLDLGLKEVGRAAAHLARGEQVEVELRGAAEIAGAELPFDLAGRLPRR